MCSVQNSTDHRHMGMSDERRAGAFVRCRFKGTERRYSTCVSIRFSPQPILSRSKGRNTQVEYLRSEATAILRKPPAREGSLPPHWSLLIGSSLVIGT